LDKLPESPSIEYLLYRIITRLDETERQVLIQMAVFRGPAPSYIWLQEALTGVALQKLIERRLLQDHQDGLVSLLPVYHTIIFRTLANEQKIQLQRQAAEIRSQLAQYTEAMYHLVEAKLPTQAIKLWDKYEQQEINRGQSHTALAILRNLAQTDLPDDLQKKLYNACAKLERLHGNLDQALKDLQIELNSTPVLEIESLEIKGEIENDRGEFDQARSTFQNALVKSDALIETRIPFIHRGLSWSYLQEWELEKALHELDIASYEIDNTRGYVLEEQNRYREAQDCYLSALATADKINHVQGIAKTANNLTALYAFLGQFDLAKEYHKRAQENYQHTGAFMNEVGSNINLALTHTLSGEYTRALEVLENLEREWQPMGFTIHPSQKVLIELIRADVYTSLEDWGAAEKSLDYVFIRNKETHDF